LFGFVEFDGKLFDDLVDEVFEVLVEDFIKILNE
jgi:hypothetical protein